MAFQYIKSDSGQRDRWVFHYPAHELAQFAQAKAQILLQEERGLEQALLVALQGVEYPGRDEDIGRLRRRLQTKGEERERCELFARELTRAGDRDFPVDVDDLVYFKMEEGISDPAFAME